MSFSGYVKEPIYIIFGVMMALVIIGLAIVALSNVALVGGQSAAIVSTGNGLTDALPFLGLILAGGIALMAIERGRRR